MGMFGFRRGDGFAGNIPQKFIDIRFPKCPMCGSRALWRLFGLQLELLLCWESFTESSSVHSKLL